MSAEKKETVRREVVKAESPPQLPLFVVQENRKRRGPDSPSFNNPDPRHIYIGPDRLDEYLRRAKVEDAFAVRLLIEALDYSDFNEAYSTKGRRAYAPMAMIGLILWGLMNGVSSLRAMERMARVDLSCMWVCGGIKPNYSIIARFLQRHETLLSDGYFVRLTSKIVEVLNSNATNLAGDGTIIEAAASAARAITAEAAAMKAKAAEEAADNDPDDEDLQKKKENAKKVAENAQEREAKRRAKGKAPGKVKVAETEPDAYNQLTKDGTVRPSYKPSVMANADRLILSNAVHPSSEKAVILDLIARAQEIAKQPVNLLLLDGNYASNRIFEAAVAAGINLLVPLSEKGAKNPYSKEHFRYDEETDTAECPEGQTLRRVRTEKARGSVPPATIYGKAPCDECPVRDKCTSSKRGREIKLYEGEEYREGMREVMRQAKAQEQLRKRMAWVEPVYGEIKEVQGLKRFRRRGIKGVTLEFSLHSMAHNLRRLVKLVGKRNPEWLEKARKGAMFALLWVLRALSALSSGRSVQYA